jgi:hypothetical protein
MAAQPRDLGWDDLIPESAAFDDPFERLLPDQLYMLATVAQYRERKAAGAAISADTEEGAEEALQILQGEGVDVDGLLARRAEISEKRRQRAMATNRKLEGHLIRMPGYVLPLEFDGERVTEFLLVPFVGACIHTPPPPPNQIIHVKIEDGYKTKGMYEPVWVSGTLKAEQSNLNLSFVDGAADIPVAYTLSAVGVERYEP